MDTDKLESLAYEPEKKTEPLPFPAETQDYLIALYYSRTSTRDSHPIPTGHQMTFNGVGSKGHGIAPWAMVGWWKGKWHLLTADWRSTATSEAAVKAFEKEAAIEDTAIEDTLDPRTVLITKQHAVSLDALVVHWKELLKHLKHVTAVDQGGLSNEYCDELLEDLRS